MNDDRPLYVLLNCAPEAEHAPHAAFDPPQDPRRLMPEVRWERVVLGKATAVPQLLQLQALGDVDVVVNLCDGAWDEDRAGAEVPAALESLGYAYTGAGPHWEYSRTAMKQGAASCGFSIPAYAVLKAGEPLGAVLDGLAFPMIVKHPWGYSSVGMTRSSKVHDAAALRREVDRVATAFGSALVEEFVVGREVSVLVVDPREGEVDAWVLPPVEIEFPPGEDFKHFDLKWKDHGRVGVRPVQDPELLDRLHGLCSATYATLGMEGYGRFDIRLDRDGGLQFLEVNAQPAVFYEDEPGTADQILTLVPNGPRRFLEHLVRCAKHRQRRKKQLWRVGFDPRSGHGLRAVEPIAEGALVYRAEGRPQAIASRSHVEQHWGERERRWFASYAFPVSDEVSGIWSPDPEDWAPINHSCDPNLWHTGLDVTARRAIDAGEQLTLDYATFCGPGMAEFDCRCGSPRCRGRVGPDDLVDPELQARYRGHLSPYVQQRLRASSRPYALRSVDREVVLAATRPIAAGSVVSELRFGLASATPTRETVMVGEHRHATLLPFELGALQHACEPNTRLRFDEGALQATRDIAPGETLSCFYPATEWALVAPFRCRCGAPSCLGRITGAKDLDAAWLSARDDVSPVVRAMVQRPG